ncbi:MAG: protein kinase domain-containing protein [Gemmatimonadaceae bacterium]
MSNDRTADPLQQQLQKTLGDAYSIERELGGGGMSRVFVAEENALGRKVVVKVLPELAAAVSVERFRREVMLAARLQHPHIVPVLSAGDAQGLPYFTMPLVEGESLRTRLGMGQKFSVGEITRMLREIASAVAYAHERGIVHRDIKPDNVLLSRGSAMVTDFGVAKAINASRTHAPEMALTGTGTSLGTPAYMAPEQAAGDDVDGRADIYAWGVMAYELLAGKHPFVQHKTAQALIAAHITEHPLSLQAGAGSPWLNALVMRCLEKNPGRRPQSAEDLVRQLDLEASSPPRGNRSRRVVLPVAGGIAFVASIALFGISRVREAGTAKLAAGTITSIAVLPFADMSPGKDQEYFSDGIAEELTTALSRIDGLRVAARTSAFSFRNGSADVREIGQKLNVGAILEGSVRRAGNKLRVTAQLVSAADGYQIWSDDYNRDQTDIFAVQDELARAIANALRLKLGTPVASAVARQTNDIEAYNLYLKGRYFWNRRTSEGLTKAIGFFKEAPTRDSSNALAYSGLAVVYGVLPSYANVSGPEAFATSKSAARRALALDSSLAEPHAALGNATAQTDHDWETSAREFRRAIALDSGYATAHHWYGLLYFAMQGDTAGAIRELTIAQRLDPLSLIINTQLGQMYHLARRYSHAIVQGQRTVELDPGFIRAHRELAWAYLADKRYDDAESEFRKVLQLAGEQAGTEMAYTYALAGRKTEADSLLQRLERRDLIYGARRYGLEYTAAVEIAWAYAALGNEDRAFVWLNRAVDAHLMPGILRSDPRFDPLRSDPRFRTLLARVKLS